MAEPAKFKKPNLRQILNDLEEELEISEEERIRHEESEYRKWCSKQTKITNGVFDKLRLEEK